MPTPPRRLIATLAALSLALAACGDDDQAASSGTTGTQAATQPDTPPAGQGAQAAISEDLSQRPSIPQPQGEPPSELQTEDIVAGDGRTARPGDEVTVQYVGTNWSTGEEFDASWNSGQPFTFTLGAGQVIPGWDQGVAGMKVGGRRKLVIPPELGYGASGSPPVIPPNETLVFVVDLLEVQR